MMKDYFVIASRNLKRRRLRTALTLIGIILAVCTIFVLVSLSIGLNSSIEEQFRLLGGDKLFIQPKGQFASGGVGGAVDLTEKDMDVVKKVSGVRDATYYITGNAKLEKKDDVRFVLAIGMEMEGADLYFETGSFKLDEGRLIEKGDSKKLLVGSQYKYNNYLSEPIETGDDVLINGVEFEVVGIAQSFGSPPDDRQIFMTEDDLREVFNITDRVDMILAQVELGEDVNDVASKVEKRLRSTRGVTEKTQDFTILTPEELLESFGQILNILTVFLVGVAAISLLVGGIGVANTMYTSVLERIKEIGVMKAVGARNEDIRDIFLVESGLVGLIGGAIGILLALGINMVIDFVAVNQLGAGILKTASPTWLIISSLIFSFLIGSFSGTWPASRASQIKPVDALRYE